MNHKFDRLELLVQKEGIEKLKRSNILLFGVGGVGSYVAESLIRSGIENITIVDFDEISESNINRQIHATEKTVGKLKIEVMKERMLDINSNAKIKTINELVLDNIYKYISNDYDYVIDAIDTVIAKVNIINYCYKNNIKLISSMGFGNKFHPELIKITDIHKTKNCPLAKIMRKKLRDLGIRKTLVVYSEELPMNIKEDLNISEDFTNHIKTSDIPRKSIIGSNSFVPSVAGLHIAGYIIRDILGIK